MKEGVSVKGLEQMLEMIENHWLRMRTEVELQAS